MGAAVRRIGRRGGRDAAGTANAGGRARQALHQESNPADSRGAGDRRPAPASDSGRHAPQYGAGNQRHDPPPTVLQGGALVGDLRVERHDADRARGSPHHADLTAGRGAARRDSFPESNLLDWLASAPALARPLRGRGRQTVLGRLRITWPSGSQLLISALIAGLGWVSGQALSQVDQDLRVMYTEYTLGAADLAHISADVMRYRNTIIRALEAPTKKEFERITESLPYQRARIQHAIDRYAAASLRVSRSGRSEPRDLQAVRDSLDQYFSAASLTIQLLTQEWNAPSAKEAAEFRRKAEIHAADNSGPKMIQVSLALDRLIETVADVAKDMRDEGTRTIRRTSAMLVGGSFFIALLNLFLTRSPGSQLPAAPPPARCEEQKPTVSPIAVPAESPGSVSRSD